MGQRINIQYSVDLDDLGEEVARMLTTSYRGLGDLEDSTVTPAVDEVLSLQTLDEVERIRRQLMKIDSSLRDVTHIVSSYVAFQAEMRKEDEPPPPAPPEVLDEISD